MIILQIYLLLMLFTLIDFMVHTEPEEYTTTDLVLSLLIAPLYLYIVIRYDYFGRNK